jgi:phosphatidylglycerophosphate synthase
MSTDAPALDAWSRAHAVVALAACALAVLVGRPWPLSGAALVSVGVLLWRSRGTFTPGGPFGPANAVTAVRCVLVLALGLLDRGVAGTALAAVVAGVWLLDGLDGWIARRRGLASPFGATFDLETDALLVLVATLQLWQRGRLGLWILVPGLLRYLYVLALATVPPVAGHVPRSRFGRLAFFGLIVGLVAACAREDAAGTALAAVGAAAVGASFARSFFWSYRRR